MKALKIIAIVAALYVGLVVAFETWLGFSQPENQSTLVLITRDADGTEHPRVLRRFEHDDETYVAVNHWPRAWYHRLLENRQVAVTHDGETHEFVAVAVVGKEHDMMAEVYAVPLSFRFLTGFPPRYFVRLDPA